jgi:hypothetical protein
VKAEGALRRAAALLVAVSAACARVPPPDLSRNPAELLVQVRGALDPVRSCRGAVRLSLSSPGQSGSLDAWVAAEKAGRLRVEVMDFFGNPAAVLVAGGGRFALYDARAGVVHVGADPPENLARILPVPLGAREVASVACGAPPLLAGQAVAAEPGDGVVLLELAGPEGRQVLEVGDGASVRKATFLPGPRGGTPWTATFSVFRHPGGRLFPTEVDLRGGGAEIGLRWRDDLEVNPAADDAIFTLDPPRGARVVELEPGTAPPVVDLPVRPATPGRP